MSVPLHPGHVPTSNGAGTGTHHPCRHALPVWPNRKVSQVFTPRTITRPSDVSPMDNPTDVIVASTIAHGASASFVLVDIGHHILMFHASAVTVTLSGNLESASPSITGDPYTD